MPPSGPGGMSRLDAAAVRRELTNRPPPLADGLGGRVRPPGLVRDAADHLSGEHLGLAVGEVTQVLPDPFERLLVRALRGLAGVEQADRKTRSPAGIDHVIAPE